MRWDGLEERVNRDPVIARFGRSASFTALVRCGSDAYRLRWLDGQLAPVARGPFVMPQCDFALAGSEQAWARFARRARHRATRICSLTSAVGRSSLPATHASSTRTSCA